MLCKGSYMLSELITDNKPQFVHTDFGPEVVEESNLEPMIGFPAIAQERNDVACLDQDPNCWTLCSQAKAEETEVRITQSIW